MKLKYKSCNVCNKAFVVKRMGHVVCSPKCAIKSAEEKGPKLGPVFNPNEKQLKLPFMDAVKKTRTIKKTKTEKPKSFYVNKFQSLFNKYIRTRDKDDPCISCGKHRTTYHAGHYLSVGGHTELRFNEDNVHKQCVYCNVFLSGNLLNYRNGLINKIGLERVLILESKHEPNKLTIPDIKELILNYKEKIRLF